MPMKLPSFDCALSQRLGYGWQVPKSMSKLAEKLKDLVYRRAFNRAQIQLQFQIRALMKQRKWNQSKLARKMKTSTQQVSNVLRGSRRLSLESLYRLSEAFDCGLMIRFVPFSELAKSREEFEPDGFSVPPFGAKKDKP